MEVTWSFKKDNSKEVLEQVEEVAEKWLEECGLTAERYAKAKCPVDTGRLKNSISHATQDKTEYIGTNVEYAAYVEMGTRYQKAQPYLKPAVADHVDTYRRLLENELKGK